MQTSLNKSPRQPSLSERRLSTRAVRRIWHICWVRSSRRAASTTPKKVGTPNDSQMFWKLPATSAWPVPKASSRPDISHRRRFKMLRLDASNYGLNTWGLKTFIVWSHIWRLLWGTWRLLNVASTLSALWSTKNTALAYENGDILTGRRKWNAKGNAWN